jgi:hypothetical protein
VLRGEFFDGVDRVSIGVVSDVPEAPTWLRAIGTVLRRSPRGRGPLMNRVARLGPSPAFAAEFPFDTVRTRFWCDLAASRETQPLG